MSVKKNINLGIHNIYFFLLVFASLTNMCLNLEANNDLEGKNTDLRILDKISSKNELIRLTNNDAFIYKDLEIKSIKCANSEFDDNPEIKAYIQVRDLTKYDNDNVYVYNGWMFSSSPSITPFDHPVYDIWLVNCY